MNKQLLAFELIKAWAMQPTAPANFNRFIENYNKALKEFGYIDELKEERDEKTRSNIDLLEKLEEKEKTIKQLEEKLKELEETKRKYNSVSRAANELFERNIKARNIIQIGTNLNSQRQRLIEILEGNEENE